MDHEGELSQLQKDSEMPLDELLASLPPEILQEPCPSDDDGDGREKTPDEAPRVEQRRPRR